MVDELWSRGSRELLRKYSGRYFKVFLDSRGLCEFYFLAVFIFIDFVLNDFLCDMEKLFFFLYLVLIYVVVLKIKIWINVFELGIFFCEYRSFCIGFSCYIVLFLFYCF